ncbi:MAG TPA: hypothetical protein VGT08_08440 [Terracidiphilus sp.]|nr:hypothetical protein [Terracidiphilus sp.]
MLTTALNALVLIRIGGLRLTHGGGWDGFGPLLVGLAIIGVLIEALSRFDQRFSFSC